MPTTFPVLLTLIAVIAVSLEMSRTALTVGALALILFITH